MTGIAPGADDARSRGARVGWEIRKAKAKEAKYEAVHEDVSERVDADDTVVAAGGVPRKPEGDRGNDPAVADRAALGGIAPGADAWHAMARDYCTGSYLRARRCADAARMIQADEVVDLRARLTAAERDRDLARADADAAEARLLAVESERDYLRGKVEAMVEAWTHRDVSPAGSVWIGSPDVETIDAALSGEGVEP
jgi:hypothetical protein